MGINYLAEVNAQAAYRPDIATPADTNPGMRFNVYYLNLFRPPGITYWNRPAPDGFGGFYDTPDTTRVEIYVGGWLQKAASLDAVKTHENTFFVDPSTGFLYFNVPKHPWLYEQWQLELTVTERFLHSVKDVNNPSDAYIKSGPEDTGAGDFVRTILALPTDDRKLSDPIHGSELFLSFSIQIDNSEGIFDLLDTGLYFNGPAKLYKTWKNNPTYADFEKTMIRTGVVENITINDKTLTFTCAEKFRSLEQSVCKLIPDSDRIVEEQKEGTVGKPFPIVFGEAEVKLLPIQETIVDEEWDYTKTPPVLMEQTKTVVYLAAEYISVFLEVRDSEDNLVPDASWDGGLEITATIRTIHEGKTTSEKEGDYALIRGYMAAGDPTLSWSPKLGEIVTRLMARDTGITYDPVFWDVDETDAYISNSPRLNIVIKSGTVRAAVNEVLTSDTAFLIQKNNALFTLRKWGGNYGNPDGEPWEFQSNLLTKPPSKTWSDAQKYFFSDCVVKCRKNDRTGEFGSRFVNDEQKAQVEAKYNKLKTAEFETCLTSVSEASALAANLSKRFCYLKETISVALGTDLSEVNLLDKVRIKDGENDYVSVNGRVYSRDKLWIVKAINPAQDTMTLEEWTDGVNNR
jgi:hypothetical protein